MIEKSSHNANQTLFLESIIDSLPNPVFYKDAQGAYRECNKAFCDLILGLPKHEIIGKTVFEFPGRIPEYLAKTYAEKDNELLASGKAQIYAEKVHCADGIFRIFQFFKNVHRSTEGRTLGIAGIMLDITERVVAEEKLNRQKEELDLLLSSISSLIIGVSIKDRVTHWNKHAETTFGIPSTLVLNKTFCECPIKWHWNIIYEKIADALINASIVRIDDLRYQRPDGSEGILGLTINPLLRDGEILEGFLILGRDLTERRNLEHQLLQARKLEALGQLAAGIAHEINSPLQYIGDNLKFIARGLETLIALLKKNMEPQDTASSFNLSDEHGYLFEELPKAAAQSLLRAWSASRKL